MVDAEPAQPTALSAKDTSCNAISGLYRIVGENISDPMSQYAKPKLYWSLFLREPYLEEPGGVRNPQISIAAELVWNNQTGILDTKILGESPFSLGRENYPIIETYSTQASCTDGKITYEVKYEGYSEGGTKNRVTEKIQLSKDNAGNLISNGRGYIESADILIFKRSRAYEANARFAPFPSREQ